MEDRLWALLVHHDKEPMGRLAPMLLNERIKTRRVRCCSEVSATFEGPMRPALVLTDTRLPDGTWLDVLTTTRAAAPEVPVIVVSAVVDVQLYLDVLDKGGHDFVVPPVTSDGLAHIIRAAILKSPGRKSQPNEMVVNVFRSK